MQNKSMYAILGILSLSPGTGYDIKKYCDKVLSGFWNENFGHIYPTLKMLLEAEMIAQIPPEEAEQNTGDNSLHGAGEIEEVIKSKDRRISYRITQKGEQELKKWLAEETQTSPVRSEFMLKLLFSNNLPSEKVTEMLMQYKRKHQENVTRYNQMLQKLEQADSDITNERVRYLRAVLRRGILADEATIKWCEETLQEL